ncbi:MAG: hypothetical protein JW780_06015 [Clostridiales bacterium]|nr:hypothetical protein [Clostridiales bacterium]
MEKMLKVSDMFRELGKREFPANITPLTAASFYYPIEMVMKLPILANVAAGFSLWWKGNNRFIITLSEDTAAYLRRVSLSFVPDRPPALWEAGSIVIESRKQDPIIENIFSINAYQTLNAQQKPRYYFTCFDTNGGALNFSISTETGTLNQKIAQSGSLLEAPFLNDLEYQSSAGPAIQQTAFTVLVFVFAASYYIENGDYLDFQEINGPPRKKENGRVEKKDGKTIYSWAYRNYRLQTKRNNEGTQGDGRELNTEGLSREPVIVRPHIRMINDRVTIIDQYDSHRWKNPEQKPGTKIGF